MKKIVMLLIVFGLVACSAQEELSPSTPPEPTATKPAADTPMPTNTAQPTSTVELPTATATRAPTSTPAFETGTLMTNPIDGATMAYIPPGEFMMGSETGKENEQPVHLVYTKGVWMYQYEVTNAQFGACVAAGGCKLIEVTWQLTSSKTPEWVRTGQYGNHPVFFINYNDAEAYCIWASGRLPTEAEWEKAARGGLEEMNYPWGNDEPVCSFGAFNGSQFKNCDSESENPTAPVGSFAPNGFGLFDMAGNVWEWVSDAYDENYYSEMEYANPQGPMTGSTHLMRGGDYRGSENAIRVSIRSSDGNTLGRENPTGFRCVVDLIP